MLVTAHSNTNSSWKYGFYTTKHYLNADEPLGLIAGEAAPSNSYVKIGGGYSEINAATDLEFYTANNTTTTTGTQRMCVKSDGKIGIGTSSPTAVLHVNSSGGAGTGFRLVDGSQGVDKVLTSDANGNATWSTNVAITSARTATLRSTSQNIGENTYTGTTIVLPPGKWSLQVNMLAQTSSSGDYWVRTGFSTSNSTFTNAYVVGASLVSGFAHGSNIYNNITGTVIINNTTGSNLTLYYWTQGLGTWNGGSTSALFSNFGGSGWGENSIVAYPMN
jgi:hypothetical protein